MFLRPNQNKIFIRKHLSVEKLATLSNRLSTFRSDSGLFTVDTMVGAVLVGISGALTLSLINNANDGMFNMNLHSKAGLAKAARMEEIREEAFKLHCTSGCSDGSIDTNLDYDKSEIEDHCSNQTLGLALLERLQNKNPDLASDFDLQNYDPTSPSLPIFSNITANGNSLIVTLSSDAAKTPMTSTIVPNALGWCK